ncbi:hypothetical protein ABEB36_006066 [Hypothenemus hampei]|uniref:Uncharacterized protein n=1 Tax=Hypothenemus hampei TaxID=57062 RepID=A0ABD1F0J3_HYPHA
MIRHALLICSLFLVSTNAQRYSKSIQIQPRSAYSTNVVHQYPNDLHAESSIKVDFQPQQVLSNGKNRGNGNRYTQSNNPISVTRPPYLKESKGPNLFNVGYNLNFKDNGYPLRKPEEPRRLPLFDGKKFENAEVITGRLKKNEKVRAPSVNPNLSPQDFVSQAFLKQKASGSTRYTSSPTNTMSKYAFPTREQVSKYPSQSPTFTYNTQQTIFKDVIKATRPDPIQLSPDFKTSYETNGNKWTSDQLEPQEFDQYFRKQSNADSQAFDTFDHEVAIKNSETFDFSNAHGEINFGNNKEISDVVAAGSNAEPTIVQAPVNFNSNGPPATDLNNINIEAHIPKNLRGVKPLPLDTSLLKDPVLTTNFNEVPQHGKVIPIHFDVRPIQTVMQREISKAQNYATYQNPYGYAGATNDNLDQGSGSNNANVRMYGQPEDKGQYKVAFAYGKEPANYEEDIYKIVSMRPPPITPNLRY